MEVGRNQASRVAVVIPTHNRPRLLERAVGTGPPRELVRFDEEFPAVADLNDMLRLGLGS